MTPQQRLEAIETALSDIATDWSAESLAFVLSQYVNPDVLTEFATERVKTFVGTAAGMGIEPTVTMLMTWLDGFVFGARFQDN